MPVAPQRGGGGVRDPKSVTLRHAFRVRNDAAGHAGEPIYGTVGSAETARVQKRGRSAAAA